MRFAIVFALCFATLPLKVAAQDDQTLADIRQELTMLYVEVQRLRRELSTTGSAGIQTGGDTVLERMSVIESELQRLTSKTEQLEFRVNRIVEDGTNRIGDLEFRLVELEGGDIGALGETTTLGGDVLGEATTGGGSNAPVTPAPQDNGLGGAAGGTLTFMAGGSDDAFAKAAPLFDIMGQKAVHCGEAGAGQAAKICNNMILGVTMIATCEAFALADKLGLDRQKMFDVVSTSSGYS